MMHDRNPEGDPEAGRLERRWFAAFKAASNARAECEELLEAMAASEAAWNRARARLSLLEAVRDSLGEELAALDDSNPPAECAPRAVRLSAA